MARIAILEDERPQAEQLRRWLEDAEHLCRVYERGEALLRDTARESFDLFILDWHVPDLSGFEVLKWLRANKRERPPIVFSTSRSGEEDLVRALDAGADDYLVKPLRRMEALARISSVLRRSGADDPREPLEVGPVRLNPLERLAYVEGRSVNLTPKEFDLAVLLLRNSGRLLSRAHLLEAVWRKDAERITTRTVDTHVSMVRTKLRLGGQLGWRIASVYQFGYRLEQYDSGSPTAPCQSFDGPAG